MKKITEELIFDLIDGKLSEEERTEVLKELSHHPEEEALYRSLLLTEGYIKANAVERAPSGLTERITEKVDRMVKQKKRNGILYRALSIVGLITASAMIGTVMVAGDSGGIGGDQVGTLLDFFGQATSALSFLSAGALQNLFFLIVAFTFFVFMDRVLMNRFHYRH